MSVRLVLVLGVRQLMDSLLTRRGIQPTFAAGYRISDNDVMLAAAEATGAARVQVEAALSKVCHLSNPRPSPCLPSHNLPLTSGLCPLRCRDAGVLPCSKPFPLKGIEYER